MAKKKKSTELVPQTVAKRLEIAEKEKESIKSTYEAHMKPLEAEIAQIRLFLLEALQRNGIKSIKTENGTVFARVSKTSFEVVDEEKAYIWGQENNCLRLDKITASKILLRALGVPEGFQELTKEYISIKRDNG